MRALFRIFLLITIAFTASSASAKKAIDFAMPHPLPKSIVVADVAEPDPPQTLHAGMLEANNVFTGTNTFNALGTVGGGKIVIVDGVTYALNDVGINAAIVAAGSGG